MRKEQTIFCYIIKNLNHSRDKDDIKKCCRREIFKIVVDYFFCQDQQREFIKFACNQERLPGRCSCQDGTSDVHVPPYPMKIGPPDGRGVL